MEWGKGKRAMPILIIINDTFARGEEEMVFV